MFLDLREIIGVPGEKISFEYEPDLSDAVDGLVVGIEMPSRAAGNVMNSAGVLTFSAIVDVICICICAKCLKEFEYPVHQQINVYLNDNQEEGHNPDGYFLDGDKVDADEIILTEFILNMDQRLLCREDCAGLCERCGADLNEGQCTCEAEVDPRLAVLGRLLSE